MQAASNNPAMMGSWPRLHAPRWIHGLAVLTVIAAFPLLFLGAEVTTKGVGMADQRPVVNPLAALWEIISGQQGGGWVIEHSHRLAGWFVGVCGIALAAVLWLGESRRWLQWLGTAALLLIIAQGLLGIFRVQLNAILGPTLAWVHGSFAPTVFATLVSVALGTSAGWSAAEVANQGAGQAAALRRWSLGIVAMVYLQLVLGGMVRHQGSMAAARGHLLGAFVVAASLLWLVKLASAIDACRWANRTILALLAAQTLLGIEAWFSWTRRYFVPSAAGEESTALHWLRSGHYVVGTMLLATTVVLMLQIHRSARAAEAPA
jgi:heme a synthase